MESTAQPPEGEISSGSEKVQYLRGKIDSFAIY